MLYVLNAIKAMLCYNVNHVYLVIIM